MLHVLIGDDDYSICQSLEQIKKGCGDPGSLMSNTAILDGKQVKLDQLQAACDTVPFLAERRLVVVEGLLSRFEGKGKSGKKGTARAKAQPDECQALTEYCRRLPEFTELVLIDGRIGNQNPLLRALATQTSVKTFPLLNTAGLRQWIEKRVAAAGGSISKPAVDLLVRFVGNDLWVMSHEVEKLILFISGGSIGEEDVREVVGQTREANIFTMIDAILELKTGLAQGLLAQLFKQGVAPVQILVMLSRQVRIIYQIRIMNDEGKSRMEIQRKLGLNSDFVFRKAWEQAEKYSPARLEFTYHQLLEADLSIKTGKCEGELALNILIAELGHGSPQPARR